MGFLGISHISERNFSEISAGETRLVLIARALVHDPEALLLDEPTSSLDPGATVELRQIMRKIAARGKTLIVITHNLSDIIPEIKRVIMIAGGKIVADGSKEELLKPECLAGLFGIKLEVFQRNGYYYMIT
jgi:iron complex transport system ATP-binding protein